jgi:hypothetical protein
MHCISPTLLDQPHQLCWVHVSLCLFFRTFFYQLEKRREKREEATKGLAAATAAGK